jgi:outer membrane receptor protein involved in Fe transport
LGLVVNVWIGSADAAGPVWVTDDDAYVDDAPIAWETDQLTAPAQFQQALTPQIEASPSVPLPGAATGAAGLAARGSLPAGASVVSGAQASIMVSTDAGDLLGNSPMTLDLGVQRRNPIVNDPRIRGSQIGSLAASGSYWVPARIDLDTMVSKIDSRIVDHAIVIPGPYSALYGPGKQFVDFQLRRTPRYDEGFTTNGASIIDFSSNGEHWYGRQSFWGGDDVWGFRVGYGHRTGNDYEDGSGTLIPGSFKSRDIDLALGAQVTPYTSFEGQALRLDQTDVELAGQAFDIDWLVTDGYEFEYDFQRPGWADRVTLDAWYNRTRFEGSAQRPSKRKQFPFYDILDFVGFTDVDSMSTGYRLIAHWEGADEERLDAGADLRFVKQNLNEITSGRRGFGVWTDANSPIPRSDWVNPGLFVEASLLTTDVLTATTGARLDYVGTRVLDDPAELQSLGTKSQAQFAPLSAADYWGSGDIQENDILGLGYLSLDMTGEDGWQGGGKVGYSERAPNLTERYAVEPFMDLIQNGLNTVTGDPELNKERLLQADLRFGRETERFRAEFVAFHAWVHDYVTFEATSVAVGPPDGQVEQVNLRFVNTDLATLFGWQARAEYDWTDYLTPFASLKYVQGTDRTRNGSFDTTEADFGVPSMRTFGVPRGSNNGIDIVAEKEPLPSILPLESRVGVRWEDDARVPRWGVEISARIVDDQNRVAASLLETATPGFTVWDLRTFFRPVDDWQLVAGVENFTDKLYLEHLDFRSRNPLGLSSFREGVNFYFGSELEY